MSIIDHIINIWGLSKDSTMAEFIKQQGWTEFLDGVTLLSEEVTELQTVNDNGSHKAKPLAHPLRKFKGFLLFFSHKCRQPLIRRMFLT
jgi:hypothetical protein